MTTSVTRRLDAPGFIAQMTRLHVAKGWNIESELNKQRMNEYWKALAYYCTTAELTAAVDRLLTSSRFPEIPQIKAAIGEVRRSTLPQPVAPEALRSGDHTGNGWGEFTATMHRIKQECFKERPPEFVVPGDAQEPEPAA
jgi:hypothetical protein